jgi:hypothetical protein
MKHFFENPVMYEPVRRSMVRDIEATGDNIIRSIGIAFLINNSNNYNHYY